MNRWQLDVKAEVVYFNKQAGKSKMQTNDKVKKQGDDQTGISKVRCIRNKNKYKCLIRSGNTNYCDCKIPTKQVNEIKSQVTENGRVLNMLKLEC